MNRFRWPLLLLIVCLPLVLLAAGFRLPWRKDMPMAAAAVPAGDCELAWFNTATSGSTWERFVTGVERLAVLNPTYRVDDANAYPVKSTAVPEVVIAKEGVSAKIRIRWYKQSSDQTVRQWLSLLAKRDPAPLAIISGSSSDRARDFALALEEQTASRGARPLFALTGATAIDVAAPPGSDKPTAPLLQLYNGRTFRFCFNNRQMAGAMLEFVWQHPDLTPTAFDAGSEFQPAIFSLSWRDDPYSEDMVDQCGDALPRLFARREMKLSPKVFRWQVPFSIGGFSTPNAAEAEAASSILKELRTLKQQRSLLVIPTVPAPARRLLMRLCEEEPMLGRQLVALNGDGMGVNAVLRDGDYNWPLASLPVPLVLFTHNNPAAWDDAALREPNSTEDVLHNTEIVRIFSKAIFDMVALGGPVDADQLAALLRVTTPKFFDDAGNRLGSTGEYVLVLRPRIPGDASAPAAFEVWKRSAERVWQKVTQRTLPLGGPR